MHKFLKIKIFCLLILFACDTYSQNADINILRSINAKTYPNWDEGMKGVSNSIYVVMPLSFILPFSQGYYKKDEHIFRMALRSAANLLVATGISTSLKYIVNRNRPFVSYPLSITQRDKNVGPYSFPSGHTSLAFASATNLSLTYKKWYITVPAYFYASMVGYSRMRLGVHYPTDVLAGALIGIGSGFLVWKLDEIWLKKKKTKVATE